jgi:DNA helicase-4
VDFNDMINKATEYISKGVVKTKYGYILVDEFQDISQSRYRLLRALLDSNPECKLFTVGDDWQSIYRFAGSDLNIMTKFDKHFGESETLFVDESFRLNNKISDFSTRFILANPKQIRKSLKPRDAINKPAVSLIYTSDPDRDVNAILARLNELGGSVLILARYNYQNPKIGKYYNLSVKFLSAHRSKGTESDYVILLGLESGVMGFPCGIFDDPLLSLVMSKEDDYPNAEERRLFYVAVTRARKHVYLLADNKKPSIFISEVLRGGYEIDFSKNDVDHSGVCPRCSGAVEPIEGEYGKFYSCRNYPYCTYRAPRCTSCDNGYLVLREDHFICTRCGKSYSQCPSCREGHLVARNGRYGGFWGCSNYPDCNYTLQHNRKYVHPRGG